MCADVRFSCDISLGEIDRLILAESDALLERKLIFFRLKKLGFSTEDAADLLCFKSSTAYEMVRSWNEGGYNALVRKPGAGRKGKLNKEQMEQLNILLENKKKWTMKEIIQLIDEELNVQYSYHGLRYLLETHFPHVKIENGNKNRKKEKETIEYTIKKHNNLSKDQINEINKFIELTKKEKDSAILRKLFYLTLKTLGLSTKDSAFIIGVSSTTGNNWQRKWNAKQYDGLIHRKGQGKKPKLDDEMLKTLKKN